MRDQERTIRRLRSIVAATLVVALLGSVVGVEGIASDCLLLAEAASSDAHPSTSAMPCCARDGDRSARPGSHCLACAPATLSDTAVLTPPSLDTFRPLPLHLAPIRVADRPFHPPQASGSLPA